MLYLKRKEDSIEIENPTWAEMLVYLFSCGWRPSVPPFYYLSENYSMNQSDTESFCDAADGVFQRAVKSPMATYSAIKFDMSKFYEVVEFARGGEFIISGKK